MNGVVRTTHRSTTCVARAIAMFIANFLKGFDTTTQHTIIEKVLSHDLLSGMLPSYLQDIKRLKQNEQLFENVHSSLIGHVTCQRAFKLALAKDSVCTFASSHFFGEW
jgi:hypothetical protein